MNAFSTRSPLLIYFIAAVGLMSAGQAHARRGFMVVTYGDTISDLGQVRGEYLDGVKQETGPALDHVGFKYEYFGVFWLDFWNWGGEYCIYTAKTFYPVTKAQAAVLLGTDEAKLESPFNYRFPIGLSLLLAMGLFKVLPGVLARKKGLTRIPEYNSSDRTSWTPLFPPSSSSAAGAPPALPMGYAATPPPPIPGAGMPVSCAPPLPPPLPPPAFQPAEVAFEAPPRSVPPLPVQSASPPSFPPPRPPLGYS